jgi:hypothetical protein
MTREWRSPRKSRLRGDEAKFEPIFDAANPNDGSVLLRRRQPYSPSDRIGWQDAGCAQPADFPSSATAVETLAFRPGDGTAQGTVAVRG